MEICPKKLPQKVKIRGGSQMALKINLKVPGKNGTIIFFIQNTLLNNIRHGAKN